MKAKNRKPKCKTTRTINNPKEATVPTGRIRAVVNGCKLGLDAHKVLTTLVPLLYQAIRHLLHLH